MKTRTPPGVVEIHLTESPPQEGSEILDWKPPA